MEDDELLEAYTIETQDQCSRAEELLFAVENGTITRPVMDNLFRIAHTIKGSGMGVGVAMLPDFVHHLEDILTRTRDFEFPVKFSDATITLFLQCNDAMQEFVGEYPKTYRSGRNASMRSALS
ncbi:MAG: Hpt domain-containing protein [Nannocystaceae bacterium]